MKNELLPFKKAVENGVKMVMVGHIAMPGLDDSNVPASHSKKITTDLLRKEWDFDGLIITDGMEMGGLTENAWAGESAIRAVEAGCDILLLPMDVEATRKALLEAVKNGRISIDRINQSVERIWKAKQELNLFSDKEVQWDELEGEIGKKDHYKVANEIANKSITGISIITSSGGLAEVNGFSLISSSSIILGFSFGGAEIPFNSNGVLINVTFSDITDNICIENPIFSGTSGNGLIIGPINCFLLDS